MADLWRLALASTGFATERPLYAAMDGASAPGRHRRTGDDLLIGFEAFRADAEYCTRAIGRRSPAPGGPAGGGLRHVDVRPRPDHMPAQSSLLGAVGPVIHAAPVRAFATLPIGRGDAPDRVRASVLVTS